LRAWNALPPQLEEMGCKSEEVVILEAAVDVSIKSAVNPGTVPTKEEVLAGQPFGFIMRAKCGCLHPSLLKVQLAHLQVTAMMKIWWHVPKQAIYMALIDDDPKTELDTEIRLCCIEFPSCIEDQFLSWVGKKVLQSLFSIEKPFKLDLNEIEKEKEKKEKAEAEKAWKKQYDKLKEQTDRATEKLIEAAVEGLKTDAKSPRDSCWKK